MIFIEAKEFFDQAYRINDLIDSKTEMIAQLRCRAEKMTSTLSPVRVQSSGSGRTMADTLDLIADLEAEIHDDSKKLFDILRMIIRVIQQIPHPDYQLILEKRYICGKTFSEIPRELNYSESHIMRMYDAALDAAVIPKDDDDPTNLQVVPAADYEEDKEPGTRPQNDKRPAVFRRRPMCRRVMHFSMQLRNANMDEDLALVSAEILFQKMGRLR